MKRFVSWLGGLPGQVVFVAWPAVYDFMFVYWYLMKFVGQSPFQWSGLDIKSYYMGMSRIKQWRDVSIKALPSAWLPENPLEHVAVNDAVCQGHMFCQMHVANLQNQ